MATRKPARGSGREARARWIMLMPNLVGPATTKRVRLWRRLQSIGAVAVRPSVYVLPTGEAHVETFQWVAREIAEMGGQASLCEGQFFDGAMDDEIERKFREARDADYAEVGDAAREVAKALKRGRVSSAEMASLDAQLLKLRRRFDEIVAIDFCGASERGGTEGALMAIEQALGAKRSPKEAPKELERVKAPRGAVWVTRVGVHVDRIACAWLIRRFVDPKGELKFVPPKGYSPKKGEVRFDMFEAEHTHVGDRCSFEVILERMGPDDAALRALGEIIHDIDLRDEKFGRAETAGVRSQIVGICKKERDDLARIEAATPMFDALYAFFGVG